jgi:hypothetical protein
MLILPIVVAICSALAPQTEQFVLSMSNLIALILGGWFPPDQSLHPLQDGAPWSMRIDHIWRLSGLVQRLQKHCQFLLSVGFSTRPTKKSTGILKDRCLHFKPVPIRDTFPRVGYRLCPPQNRPP